MKMTDNTILITGGETGMGFSLTEVFLNAGNRVILTGRREEKLRETQAAFDGMANDEMEIAIGQAQGLQSASLTERRLIFQRMNGG